MKILNKIFILATMLIFAVSCQKGIDPITQVDPGPDQADPVVKINYPTSVTILRDDAVKVPVKIQCEASDDIELVSIVLKMDGTQIATFNSFKDYRRGVEEYIYDGVGDGKHTLEVTATDLAGKTSSQSVTFEKTTPYHALYEGEVFYMPFDGDAIEQISNTSATVIGTPTYTDGKKVKAYTGATGASLNFPTTGLLGGEFSVAFWYKLNQPTNVPEQRGGLFAIARPYTVYNDTTRFKGLRIFREGTAASQNIGLNFGIGKAEVWISPMTTLAVTGNWVHIAISISATTATVYINNKVASTTAIAKPIDWTGCTPISIMSGKPNFSFWDHNSDISQMDELRIFNKAITAGTVSQLYGTGK